MTQSIPCVSIGLPVYNGENFIREAIDSILAQTFTDFELIISDNASNDCTEIICREYAQKDPRIHYIRNQDNIGAAPNYNQTFKLSKGKYFKWTSHDDLYAPEFLERCVQVLEDDENISLCFPRTILIDENKKEIKRYSNQLTLESEQPQKRFEEYRGYFKGFNGNPIFGVMRSRHLKNTDLIGSHIASDMTLLGHLALLGKFYEVTEYLFFRRRHPLMSVRANQDYDKRILWFNPKKNSKLLFPHWQLFLEDIKIISSTPIRLLEKLSCYKIMLLFLVSKSRVFVLEIAINIARLFNIHSISILGFNKNLPTQW